MTPSLHGRSGGSLRKAGRGATLLEALIALLLVSLGLVALAGLQLSLRHSADHARQLGDATHLATEALESQRQSRAATAMPPPGAWRDEVNGNTRFELSLEDSSLPGGLRALRATVRWRDRHGDRRQLALDSLVQTQDPALSAALALPPAGRPMLPIAGMSTPPTRP